MHLQCHIGTDTPSLHRLGAAMTGLDCSAESVAQARALAARVGASVEFVQASVDDAVEVLGAGRFDLVFTGIGALPWLPDVGAWARTVAALLRPGGELFLREGHPVLRTVDETRDDALVVRHPYFQQAAPTVFETAGTSVETDAPIGPTRSAQWNHGLGEVVAALLAAGLRLTLIEEHRSVPWRALPGRMVRTERGEWALAADRDLLPLTDTLRAVKAREGAGSPQQK